MNLPLITNYSSSSICSTIPQEQFTKREKHLNRQYLAITSLLAYIDNSFKPSDNVLVTFETRKHELSDKIETSIVVKHTNVTYIDTEPLSINLGYNYYALQHNECTDEEFKPLQFWYDLFEEFNPHL